MAFSPRCFRCCILILSGPVDLLFSASFIALRVSAVVIVIGVICSL